ncbi:unnamed protein product [Auanema sp. JU1783]|nr:unnamed protein product [Auanema sp. JU1783]
MRVIPCLLTFLSTIIRITLCKVPSQPLNFDVNLISATEARYTWEAPKDFSGHGYYLYADKLVNGQPENGLLRKKKVVFDKKASHAEVDDLEPNTEYSFRMNAFNFHGDGEFTPTKILLTGGLPPRQPEILSVELLNEDPPLKARIEWKRPSLKPLESPIEKFHIWYRAEGSDKKTHVTIDGTKTSVELKGLWMGRVYDITLAAENIEGKSVNATEKLGTPTGLPDGEPLHVQYEINEDTMRISWDPPEEEKRNGNISSYKAILTPMDAEGARKEEEVQGLQHSFKVDTRKAYTFKVAASTMKGLGPYSPVLTINPDPSS